FLLFFSLVATKLPNYVLPVTTPLALLTASCLDRWRRGLIQPPAWLMASGLIVFALVGVFTGLGMLAAGGILPLQLRAPLPVAGLERWAVLGLIPVVGAAVASWALWRRRRFGCLVSLTAAALLFLGALAAGVAPAFNAVKAPYPLVVLSGAGDPER